MQAACPPSFPSFFFFFLISSSTNKDRYYDKRDFQIVTGGFLT